MAKGYLYDNGDELISRENVNEVPDSSSAHAGDVLSLDSNKKPKWSIPESGLPDTTGASAGDVLTLDSDKDPVWSAPSGGDSEVLYVSISVEDNGISFYNMDGELLSFSDMVGKKVIVLSSYDASSYIYADEGETEGEPWTAFEGRIFRAGAEKLFIYFISEDSATSNQTEFPYTMKTITYDTVTPT